jgi:hypothetical protein
VAWCAREFENALLPFNEQKNVYLSKMEFIFMENFMSTIQSLQQQIAALPNAAQQELASFLDTLSSKYEPAKQEQREWSDFTLGSAMRGMEDEETTYSVANIKERW